MSGPSCQTRRAALIVGFLATILAGGCRQPTEPTPVDGVFVLRSVGTEPVPAVTSVLYNTESWVLADTIVFGADGSGEWMTTHSLRNLTTDARDTTRTVKRFDHSRQGAAVHATAITCEPNCGVSPNHAEFHLDGEWLTRGSGSSVLRYQRIEPSAAP